MFSQTIKEVSLVNELNFSGNNYKIILPYDLRKPMSKMEQKRESVEAQNRPVKRTKKVVETSMDGLLVPSKSSFDHTSNQILTIGPPSNFDDDASFYDLSERLVRGDHKSSLALLKTLACTVIKHQDA